MDGKLSKKLRRLDDFLYSDAVNDDAMLLSGLDGFLAALIVGPDPIAPSEWLPMIWGGESPIFESEDQAQAVMDLIMGHYNDIARYLDRGSYRPIYHVDLDDSLFWEMWMEGFSQAMRLRPDAWRALAQDEDQDLQRARFVLGRLGELAMRPDDLEPLDIDEELDRLAPDLIPSHVSILHRVRLARANPFAAAANENFRKVGRNDPCPCGSGRKFKKCCLN